MRHTIFVAKIHTSFRLSPEALKIIKTLARISGVTKTAFLEKILRDLKEGK